MKLTRYTNFADLKSDAKIYKAANCYSSTDTIELETFFKILRNNRVSLKEEKTNMKVHGECAD